MHGATGAQGSPVLSALRARGEHAVAAAREAHHALGESVSADFADPDSLVRAYRAADGVFIHLPMGPTHVVGEYADTIVAAIERARPARVVISTSGQIVDGESPLRVAPGSPAARLIRGVKGAGVSAAVIEPRLYLENLLLPVVAGPARDEGILRYPLPEFFPVSWCSHADVADTAAHLLTDPDITGTVSVGHLPGLTGQSLASAFANALGRPVRYEPLTPSDFGELITPLFGAKAAPVVGLYEALNAQDSYTIDETNSAQRVLGLTPLPIEDWLARSL